jgi:Flavin-binding monooxygenase-like
MAERRFRVVVARAGVSGLFMAETLKRARIDFAVYEKASDVGGTWRANTFPGLFVDVLSRQYEFPFQPNYNWSRKYAPATEIWAYIKNVARERGLTKFIRFNREIVAAGFSDGRWHIETASGETDIADVFVCATGFLHQPLFPDIPGRDQFTGPSFHSSRWDHGVPYAGARWGVIGSGASGVQITEALAWAGCEITQFIRRAQWVHIRENPYSTWYERLKLRLPFAYRREQRRPWQLINETDRWRPEPGPQREAMEREFESYLDCIKDPDLKRKLMPDYNLGCTRIPKSDLLRGGAAPERTHHQRRDRSHCSGRGSYGGRHVYRAGRAGLRHRFRCACVYAPDEGDGSQCNDHRRDVARQDLLLRRDCVAGVMLYGPFAPVNNVPVPLGLDQEIACIMRLIAEARARRAVVAPTVAATEKFLTRLGAAFPGTVWVGGCKNWRTGDQNTPVLWPLPQREDQAFFDEVSRGIFSSSLRARETDPAH